MIYSDFSTHPRDLKQADTDKEAVVESLRALKISLFNGSGGDARSFRQVMRSTRLFENHLDIAEEFIREEFE
jgi:formiminotetrahydrofolate cyclodeaminase